MLLPPLLLLLLLQLQLRLSERVADLRAPRGPRRAGVAGLVNTLAEVEKPA